ncbi:hypothetical protein [Limnohabitans sp. 2KL-17]|uniref:hypothetical protein n=1 Tax=Limnohabitans sp. 2KL-17 TaxID=1100704 RepID=UPI0018EE4E21|nr:hypothetical protein [Limnohabitans sp. 2KL-17]
MHIVGASGASAVAILDANQPVFYVFSPDAWIKMSESRAVNVKKSKNNQKINHLSNEAEEAGEDEDDEDPGPAQLPRPRSVKRPRTGMTDSVLTQGAMRFNSFDVLAEQLIEQENQRVKRGELSSASVGILKNRLDAHVLPYFKYIPPSQVTPMMMDAFVRRLTDSQLSSTTVSQYLVVDLAPEKRTA